MEKDMARVNINILGISELKRTGMDEFSSDDHYIYYCVLGASMGDPTHNKVMWKRTVKQGFRTRGAPFSSIYP